MPSTWITAATAGIDAGMQMYGMQQQANLNLANRTFSAQQAALNRQFQVQQTQEAQQYATQMSNTAMSRRMADLRGAGVNPMLAVSGGLGGASSPQIAPQSGSMANTPQTANPAANLNPAAAINSGLQTALTAAQTRDTNAAAGIKEIQSTYTAQQAQANVRQVNASADDLTADAKDLGAKFNIDLLQKFNIDQQMRFAAQMQPIAVRAAQLENDARVAGLVPSQALAQFYQTDAGKLYLQMKAVREGGGEPAALLYGATHSAGNLAGRLTAGQADQMPEDTAAATGW